MIQVFDRWYPVGVEAVDVNTLDVAVDEIALNLGVGVLAETVAV